MLRLGSPELRRRGGRGKGEDKRRRLARRAGQVAAVNIEPNQPGPIQTGSAMLGFERETRRMDLQRGAILGTMTG